MSDHDLDLRDMQMKWTNSRVVMNSEVAHLFSEQLAALFHGLRWFLQKSAVIYFDRPEIFCIARLDCLSDGRAIEASIDLSLQPYPLAWVLRVEPTASGMTAQGHLLTKIPLDGFSSEMTDGVVKTFGHIDSLLSSDFIEAFYRLLLSAVRDFEQFMLQGLPQFVEDQTRELKLYPRINRDFLGLPYQ